MELVPVTEIPWANLSLLKEGILFGIKNLFPLMIANTAALMFGFSGNLMSLRLTYHMKYVFIGIYYNFSKTRLRSFVAQWKICHVRRFFPPLLVHKSTDQHLVPD